ncbi:MAG: LysR family transcriptional regulator, partial [Rhodospirillaceae bacterium]|nr:LysR family transcriptional regulator [Rhodospirillaceae bacterium]
MNFTLRQLQALTAVARHGSFTRAAADLGMTQSAVSVAIRHLEAEVGLP